MYADADRNEMRYPTRSLDQDKAEHELVISIKKATSPDEIAQKQVHARKCIAFTWDYHSSTPFWSGLRLHPIFANEVQTLKALIVVHKVLDTRLRVINQLCTIAQLSLPLWTVEGAHGQTDWLEMCALGFRTDESKEYMPLIRSYVQLILAKLNFHHDRLRPEFKGLFEYEEYVTLKGTEDSVSNEGYEAIPVPYLGFGPIGQRNFGDLPFRHEYSQSDAQKHGRYGFIGATTGAIR
ncbi:Sla2 family protein [Pleurotus pulmonarius]